MQPFIIFHKRPRVQLVIIPDKIGLKDHTCMLCRNILVIKWFRIDSVFKHYYLFLDVHFTDQKRLSDIDFQLREICSLNDLQTFRQDVDKQTISNDTY